MRIAYFIMAHHKPNNLLRLINAIYSEDNIYLIHIDAKANDDMFSLARQLRDNPNIFFLPSRSTTWGAWSLVQVEIDAMRFLLTNQSWTTYINLSGQDFPLVTQEKLLTSIDSRFNYLEILDRDEQLKSSQLTSHFYYVEDMGRIEILGRRKPFHDYFNDSVRQYRGSQWKFLNRAFVEYAVTSEFSHSLQDYYRYTFIPDEEFFQTLIMNSDFVNTLMPTNKRYIKGYSTDGVLFRAKDLSLDDVGPMFNSDALFARKFSDLTVLDFIESMLYESGRKPQIGQLD